MPTITLQHRLIIDQTTTIPCLSELLKISYESLVQGITFRLFTARSSSTWDDFKKNNPNAVLTINKEITDYTGHYLRSYKPIVKDISGRYQIVFLNIESEVFETDITDINKHKLAVYFLSKLYKLISNFGMNILISEIEPEAGTSTFILELSPELTIKSFTE